MMKLFLSFLAIIASLTFAAHAEEFIGHIVFYSYDENLTATTDEEKQDMVEIESDFEYHVGVLFEYLNKYRIKYEIQRKSQFTIVAINGSVISIDKNAIPVSTGYIMIKMDGSYKIRNGIGTDVDMLMDMIEYFSVKLE